MRDAHLKGLVASMGREAVGAQRRAAGAARQAEMRDLRWATIGVRSLRKGNRGGQAQLLTLASDFLHSRCSRQGVKNCCRRRVGSQSSPAATGFGCMQPQGPPQP
jgi:hypothetical protein